MSIGNYDQYGLQTAIQFCVDSVLADAGKSLDTAVLFHPSEEQFQPPSLLIQQGNQCGLASEGFGQKDQTLAHLVLDKESAQPSGVVFAGVKDG